MKKAVLSAEERAILDSYNRGEWRPVEKPGAAIARLRAYAGETVRKTRRINIRVSARDLEAIRARATDEGLPYQTLIASVLHKYITGALMEKRRG